MVAAQDGLDSGDQFLGIKRLFHVVIGAQLQPQYLVKNFPFGRQHDYGDILLCPDLSAYLISVDSGQHQIQQDQIRFIGIDRIEGGLSISYDQGFIAFLGQIQADQLRDIAVIIYDQYFLFHCAHVFLMDRSFLGKTGPSFLPAASGTCLSGISGNT